MMGALTFENALTGLESVPGGAGSFFDIGRFEMASTVDILRWAWETMGERVLVSSSFQTQSVPLLHLISTVCPGMTVLFLDTGFHFPETLEFRDRLQNEFGLNVRNIGIAEERKHLRYQNGVPLCKIDPDFCCHIHKVEPVQRALQGAAGWISGVRRDQTAHRAALRVIEPQANGLLKIHPMLNWTENDIRNYMNRFDLPKHPLNDRGFKSIGCQPCTKPVSIGEDSRSGRWAGSMKTECGLHTHTNWGVG